MINRYFNHTSQQAEQDLVQDLIDETIQIYGHEVYYIPRTAVNLDTFLGEDPLTQFTEAYPLEMYIKTVDSFQGQSEFISKFGLHIEDQATFVVSQRRFDIGVRMPAADANTTILRPQENDLIYVEMTPTNRYLFEIRFVENKEQLFQLGKLYTFELRCEMFNYTHEKVATNLPDVDAVAQAAAYTLSLTLNGGSIDFEEAETVYQGANVASATASATVLSWDDPVLLVQNITGAFSNTANVVGETSGATWAMASTPARDPSVHDGITDNALLQADDAAVVVSRGTHMLDN